MKILTDALILMFYSSRFRVESSRVRVRVESSPGLDSTRISQTRLETKRVESSLGQTRLDSTHFQH